MLNKSDLSFIIIASVLLFILNNVLLTKIVISYLGGSATGLTSLAVITFVVLKIQKFGAATIIYASYGMIGLLSHLHVKDYPYLLFMSVLIICALVFDSILLKMAYAKWGFVVGFAVFAVLLNLFSAMINPGRLAEDITKTVASIMLGFVGILIGHFANRIMRIWTRSRHDPLL